MEEKALHIGEGKVEVLLVCDDSLGDIHAPFYKWQVKPFDALLYKCCFIVKILEREEIASSDKE